MLKAVLIVKLLLDLGAAAGFWANKPMVLMFLGYTVCDVAAVWLAVRP